MAIESAIVFSGIAPHPPIMVPEVGGEAVAQVQASIDAMAEFARRVILSGAETVVLVSPHAPLDARTFVAYHSPTLHGDFSNFRAASTQVEFPLNEQLLATISETAAEDEYEVTKLKNHVLDHGTAVPLYFLDRGGWHGRVVALGYSFLDNEDHLRFGASIRKAVDTAGRAVAFVASGDLSHRLQPSSPAGYEPAAYRFDEAVVDALDRNSPDQIINIDHDLRSTAGECGYRSMLVALGATRELAPACEVLSYEAPFGVGYLVAQLTNLTSAKAERRNPAAADAGGLELPALARLAVETFARTGETISTPAHASALLAVRAACFVSIKTYDGELRGCVGTIDPTKENLADELIANAINAATRDPRFDPVSAEELGKLRYSVDVLGATEPADFADLDPKTYGVIVEDESKALRGLLLPDIPGVETVNQQVEIAARKAGIAPGVPLKLSRFRVNRYREK